MVCSSSIPDFPKITKFSAVILLQLNSEDLVFLMSSSHTEYDLFQNTYLEKDIIWIINDISKMKMGTEHVRFASVRAVDFAHKIA